MCTMGHMWRSEDNFWNSVVSLHLILPGNNSSLGDVRAETIGSHVRNASYWLIPWPAQLVSLYSPRYPAGGQYFAHQSSIKRILQSLGYRPL